MKKRLLDIIKYLDMSTRSFEAECGLQRGNISNMSEDSAIGSDKLSKIYARFPEVNLEWLITGKGSMLKAGSGVGNNHINSSTGSTIVMGVGSLSMGKDSMRGISNRVSESVVGYDKQPVGPDTPAASGDGEIDKLRSLLAEKDAILVQKEALLMAKNDIIKAKDDIIQLLMTQLAGK